MKGWLCRIRIGQSEFAATDLRCRHGHPRRVDRCRSEPGRRGSGDHRVDRAGISTTPASPIFGGRTALDQDPAAERASNINFYVGDPAVRHANWAQQPRDRCGRMSIPTPVIRRSSSSSGERSTLITKNVDELHQRAGSSPIGSSRSTAPPARSPVSNVTIATTWRPCSTGSGPVRPTRPARTVVGFSNPPRSARSEPDCRGSSAGRTCCSGVRSLPCGRDLAGGVPDQRDDQGCAQTGSKVIILNGEATVFDPIADVVLHAGISETLPRIVRRSLRYGQLPDLYGPPRPRSTRSTSSVVHSCSTRATSCLMFGSLMVRPGCDPGSLHPAARSDRDRTAGARWTSRWL